MNKFLVRCTIIKGSTTTHWQGTYETNNDRLYGSDLLDIQDKIIRENGKKASIFFDLIYKLGE